MEEQKIMVAMPLEEELLRTLHSWGKRFDWNQVGEVHFTHVVKKNITPLEFGLMELPDENAYREMVPVLDKFLHEEAAKILPPNFRGKTHFHLSIDFKPEDGIINLIQKFEVHLIVVSTRGKHGFQGLFHSSFTEHMVRFAPCDVYVIRPVWNP